MLTFLKKRRVFLITVLITLVIFDVALFAVKYSGNQTIIDQRNATAELLEKYDSQIDDAKADKLAKEKKAAEDAARKKEAEENLVAQQQGQVVTPKSCAISGAHGNPSAIDVVINKKRCFNPIDFIPSDLVSYGGYFLSQKILPDLTTMFNASVAAGVPLNLTSSYRSYANQVETYNNWVAVNGSTAAADTVSARPGYSEHQTGFAVDLSAGSCSLECFKGTAQYTWMKTYGANYGFIERYPEGFDAITGYSPEAWHWRYVGKETALNMKQSGVKTLEQLWNIEGGGY